MGKITTFYKSCPHCKKTYEIDSGGIGDFYFQGYGRPFVRCPWCAKMFVDGSIREIGLEKKSFMDDDEEYNRSRIRLREKNYLDQLRSSGKNVPDELYINAQEGKTIADLLLEEKQKKKPRCDYPHESELNSLILHAAHQVTDTLEYHGEEWSEFYKKYYDQVFFKLYNHYKEINGFEKRAESAYSNIDEYISPDFDFSGICIDNNRPLGHLHMVLRYAIWNENIRAYKRASFGKKGAIRQFVYLQTFLNNQNIGTLEGRVQNWNKENNSKSKRKINAERMFCRKCGKELLLDSVYCMCCGTKI